jgi:L-lactate dehydrogenase complex protein LldE
MVAGRVGDERAVDPAGSPVAVFATCLADIAYPQLAGQVSAVLRWAGVEPVACRGATCCGQPAFNAGYHRDARRVARRTLDALSRRPGEIVVPSGSCTAMIVRHWSELFAGDRDEQRAVEVAGRVHEFSAFAATRLPAASPLRLERTVAYHDSCHMLRELGIFHPPRALLAAVEGVELREVAGHDRCCGFGGTFSVRYPELSVAMADSKLDDAVGVDLIATCDGGCQLQLAGRSGRRGGPPVVHLAELLCEAGAR